VVRVGNSRRKTVKEYDPIVIGHRHLNSSAYHYKRNLLLETVDGFMVTRLKFMHYESSNKTYIKTNPQISIRHEVPFHEVAVVRYGNTPNFTKSKRIDNIEWNYLNLGNSAQVNADCLVHPGGAEIFLKLGTVQEGCRGRVMRRGHLLPRHWRAWATLRVPH